MQNCWRAKMGFFSAPGNSFALYLSATAVRSIKMQESAVVL
jgi:hypothetical protein